MSFAAIHSTAGAVYLIGLFLVIGCLVAAAVTAYRGCVGCCVGVVWRGVGGGRAVAVTAVVDAVPLVMGVGYCSRLRPSGRK